MRNDFPQTGLKPSEAIRKGCELVPKQAFHQIYPPKRIARSAEAACALGAMLIGARPEILAEWRADPAAVVTSRVVLEVYKMWPFRPIAGMVIHLNDTVGLSREEIADWLEARGW